ncbi:MAG: deoxyribonuclease IV [Candidatus Rokuibacteriota bacterium]
MSPASSTPDLLGAHMSIAGGLFRALERGREVGCGAVQIFLRNQRQWAARPYTDSEVREFRAAWKATGVRVVFAHANYLINLATPVPAEWRRAVDAFHDELERAEALGLPFVVIHPGSHRDTGLEEGIRRVAGAIDALHERTRGYRGRIVLENTAGGGSSIGRSFEELAAILAAVREPARVGVCLDTCHLFAAGYPLDEPERAGTPFDELRDLRLADRLGLVHANDSRDPRGSRRDRHDRPGRGSIGQAGFRGLLADPLVRERAVLVETPGREEEHALDVATLRRLAAV